MKMTGRSDSSLSRFRRLQVSKPLMPGMTRVHQHQVGRDLVDQIQRALAVGGDQHGESGLIERIGEQAAASPACRPRPARCRGAALCRLKHWRASLPARSCSASDRSSTPACAGARRPPRGRDPPVPVRAAWPRCRARGRCARAGTGHPDDGASARWRCARQRLAAAAARRAPAGRSTSDCSSVPTCSSSGDSSIGFMTKPSCMRRRRRRSIHAHWPRRS